MFPVRAIQTVDPWEAIDFSRWIGIVNVRDEKGDVYECYWLQLPCYGMHYDMRRRTDAWSRLMLFWHGRTGLEWWWEPVR